jgi:hypothetical protein
VAVSAKSPACTAESGASGLKTGRAANICIDNFGSRKSWDLLTS